jgi:hypothetical protein
MGSVVRTLRYLAGLALVAAGACYLGVRLAETDGPAGESLVELFRSAFSSAEPKSMAIGAALVVAGVLLARPFFAIEIRGRERDIDYDEWSVLGRVVGYLLGAALALAGASFLGIKQALALAAAEGPPGETFVEIVRTAFASAEPAAPAIAAAVVVVGFMFARPIFPITITWEKKRRERKMSARQALEGIRSRDPNVRLDAATSLCRAADASTIPALISALMDPAEAVRGQACEALARITGETFDFVDVGPESMRAESVAMWQAWWRQNKDDILSGADPRRLAAEPVDLAAAAAAAVRPSSGRTRRPGRKTSRTVPVRRTTAPARAPAVEPELPSLDDEIAAAIDQVVSADEAARVAPRRTPAPASRRGRSGDSGRKKRMRDAKAAAMGQTDLKSVMPSAEELAAIGPMAPAREETESPEDMLQDLVSGIEIDPDDLPNPDEDLPPID